MNKFLQNITRRFSVTEANQKTINKKRERMTQVTALLKNTHIEGEPFQTHATFSNKISEWFEHATEKQIVGAFDEMKYKFNSIVSEGYLENDGWKCISRDEKRKTSTWTNEVAPQYKLIIEDTKFSILNGRTTEVDTQPLSLLTEILTENKRSGAIPGSITNRGTTL